MRRKRSKSVVVEDVVPCDETELPLSLKFNLGSKLDSYF